MSMFSHWRMMAQEQEPDDPPVCPACLQYVEIEFDGRPYCDACGIEWDSLDRLFAVSATPDNRQQDTSNYLQEQVLCCLQ